MVEGKASRNAGAGPGAGDAGAAGPEGKRTLVLPGLFGGDARKVRRRIGEGVPSECGWSRGFVGDEIFAVAKFLARSSGMADFWYKIGHAWVSWRLTVFLGVWGGCLANRYILYVPLVIQRYRRALGAAKSKPRTVTRRDGITR